MVQTGSQLGPYRLQRRIGAGGMAEVFLGQRMGAEGFARNVAIKTILAVGAEEEGIGLFLDEARVASYLEHAAIVQTVDLGFENETLFIVMEYVPGPALSRMIRDLKKLNRYLSPRVVAYIGARVASALDYAWSRASTPDGKVLRLVHRDISPQNILITRTGNVKLTDFGVARASVQTHKTRTGQVRGKAAYMAPEQVRAGLLDGRTDVFALALVLYEALTGVRAFQRKTDIMSMRAILTDEVTPIKDVNPAVPDDVIAVLKKACAKKPDERYQTAAELCEALQRTYRSHSEAAIEAELVGLINELFGPEQFGTEGAVEAWQPTISAQSEQSGGSNPTPHRISAGRLSPKIAAMLASSPQSSPSIETPSQPFDDDMDVDLGSFAGSVASVRPVTGQRTPAGVAFLGVAGTREESQPSLPGMPVMGNTQAHAMTSAAFNEPVPGSPGATRFTMPPPANGTAAYSSFDQSAVKPRGRALLWGAGAFAIAMIGALSILLVSPDRDNADLVTPLEVTAQPGINPREPETVKAKSSESSQRTIEALSDQEQAKAKQRVDEPRDRDRDRVRREPPQKRAEQPREVKQEPEVQTAAVEATPVDKPAEKVIDKKIRAEMDSFVLKALAARNKPAVTPELAAKLTKAINDVMANKPPTFDDWELVKKAQE